MFFKKIKYLPKPIETLPVLWWNPAVLQSFFKKYPEPNGSLNLLFKNTRTWWCFNYEFVQNTHRFGGGRGGYYKNQIPAPTMVHTCQNPIYQTNTGMNYELPTFNCLSGLCTTFCNYMGKRQHIDIGNRLVPHAAFEPRAIFWTLRGKGIQNFVRKWRCDDHKGSIFDLTCWFWIVVKSRKRGGFAQHHITVDQSLLLWEMDCSSSPCRWIASMKDSFFFQSLCGSFQRSVFQAQVWDDAMRGILDSVSSLLRMLMVSFLRLWTFFFFLTTVDPLWSFFKRSWVFCTSKPIALLLLQKL